MTEPQYPHFLRIIREPDTLQKRFKTMLDTADSSNPWEDAACELMADMLAEIRRTHD